MGTAFVSGGAGGLQCPEGSGRCGYRIEDLVGELAIGDRPCQLHCGDQGGDEADRLRTCGGWVIRGQVCGDDVDEVCIALV